MYNFKINGIYHTLHKFFIEVKADMLYIPDETPVYGVVIEGMFWRNEQSLLACYSTGFVANYMLTQGGKVGKYYREGDMSVITDIIDIYDSKQLKGQEWNEPLNNQVKELVLLANENIEHNKLLRPNSSINLYTPNTTRIWLLAKDGVYYTELGNDKLKCSPLGSIVGEAKEIANELYDFVPEAF